MGTFFLAFTCTDIYFHNLTYIMGLFQLYFLRQSKLIEGLLALVTMVPGLHRY